MARRNAGQVTFQAYRSPPAAPPHEFAILESSYCDDDLVYAVTTEPEDTGAVAPTESFRGLGSHPSQQGFTTPSPIEVSSPARKCWGYSPTRKLGDSNRITTCHQAGSISLELGKVTPGPVRLCAVPSGKKLLHFEGFLQQEVCTFMADSGATHTFVSSQFLALHNTSYVSINAAVSLANDASVPVLGYLDGMIKLGPLRRKHRLLVVDLPSIDVVLGLDFMTKHNITLRCKARSLEFPTSSGPYRLKALHHTDDAPAYDSDLVELCTIQAFANAVRSMPEEELAEAFVACVAPELDSLTLHPNHTNCPELQSMLQEFSDVLVSSIPGGLPPERYDIAGRKIEHTIETAPDAKPFAVNPRMFSPDESAEIQRVIKEFLQKGWITPSLSPWAAPVLFVPKKPDPVTGKRAWRMCLSYVKLNAKTLNRIAYRLPRISDLLARVNGASYFSKIDLLDGFYQIRMKEEDIEKTAFTTPYGNYEFKVMPMGLCGAPSTFQFLMDACFHDPADLQGVAVAFSNFIACYLDDVCIFSSSKEEHLQHIRAVLTRLRDFKLYAKPTKCQWLVQTIEFLGHVFSSKGISVHPDKCAALQKWPTPTNVSEVRSLLGTFGFWRGYIRHYADITAPLTRLTCKNAVWRWGEEHTLALHRLKVAVATAPLLHPPDTSKPFLLVTDASDYACGASLEQENSHGERHPVEFFSHQLNGAERRYPVHERELLAIVLALRTWRHYLYGSEFKVICQTDHRPLQHFMGQTTLSPRQVRWQSFLSDYNLEVVYIPGSMNDFADGLSRRPDLRLMVIGACAPYDPWLARIKGAYETDLSAKTLIRQAKQGPILMQTGAGHYELLHGVLYFVSEGLRKVYVPHGAVESGKSLRHQLIYEFHDSPIAGHFGFAKCIAALGQHYYWPNMEADVKTYIACCDVCQRIKPTKQPNPPAHPLPVPDRPFEHITLDWVTGFPQSGSYNAVLNVVDRFTKWAIVIPCDKEMKGHDFCDALWTHVFAWIGLPASITGDRDTRITASETRKLFRYIGVKLKLSVAYRPQTDGQTERFNRIFLQMLRGYVNQYHTDWPKHIPALVYAYNNTVHSATGFTPHRFLFGWCPRDIRAPVSCIRSRYPDVDSILTRYKADFAKAKVSLQLARQRMIQAAKASPNAFEYKVGDLVKISTRTLEPQAPDTQVKKLQPKYLGPFVVTDLVGSSVKIALPDSFHSLIHDVFNVHDVRPWLSVDGFDVSLPYTHDPAQNPVVSVLDRKSAPGRVPKRLDSLLYIPAQYFVVRKNGSCEWVHQRTLKQPTDRMLIMEFERKFPRSKGKECESVASYAPFDQKDECVDAEEEPGSPDAIDLGDANWELDLQEYFRDVYYFR
jgi:RNase H-like domain found in reverse transcriptase/Reverse transcriptase (RNA-dependent DNA polymerase)/Integrase zinc binding domain/Integrase core domain/Retroviral aspartyl protease